MDTSRISIGLDDGSKLEDDDLYTHFSDGLQEKIVSSFVMLDDDTFGFKIQSNDRSRTIVIDPEIKHSVIIGGSDYDQGMDVLRDEEDNNSPLDNLYILATLPDQLWKTSKKKR